MNNFIMFGVIDSGGWFGFVNVFCCSIFCMMIVRLVWLCNGGRCIMRLFSW